MVEVSLESLSTNLSTTIGWFIRKKLSNFYVSSRQAWLQAGLITSGAKILGKSLKFMQFSYSQNYFCLKTLASGCAF